MKYIPLVQVCDFQGGSQPPKDQWIGHEKEGYIRMLQIRDFTQPDKDNVEYVRVSKTIKTCNEDDILIGRYGASVGKILTGLAGAYNVAIIKTIPDTSKLSKRFLYHYLNSPYFQNFILSVGSRAAQAGFNKEDLSDAQIPDMSLEEQGNVVSQLDKVCELITLRKEQLAKLDQLVKSRFIELFGDPESNNNNWTTVPIGDVIRSCESGWSGNGTQRKKEPGEVAVLKISAVTKGYFIPEECKVLDDQQNIKKYVFPEKGDLLFSRANTREMVGATAVIMQNYPELILPDKLWKIRFVNCANVIYMKHILSHQSIRSKFSAVSTGTSGSMFNVSMEKFKSIVIPLPPIELQERFASFVEQTDKSKLAIQQSLDKLELLKKSLMQEYFG